MDPPNDKEAPHPPIEKETSHRMRELQVLQDELKTLRKNASVYKQQQNSNIFFREDKNRVFSNAKKELDSLIKEYSEHEKNTLSQQ